MKERYKFQAGRCKSSSCWNKTGMRNLICALRIIYKEVEWGRKDDLGFQFCSIEIISLYWKRDRDSADT